jgi:hypothetical protein
MAAAVAVLHATTMALTFFASRKSAIANVRATISVSLLPPYGAWPESQKHSRCSDGSRACTWRNTDSAPTPESKMPIGASAAS